MQAVYRHNPQEDFWGIGAESLNDDRVSYLVDYTRLSGPRHRPSGSLAARPARGSAGSTASIGRGTDKRFPSIEERFTDATAPGLAEQPDFSLRRGLRCHRLSRREGQRPRRRLLLAQLARILDLDFDRYSFRAVDLLLQQFFPIFDKKRVFAVQGRLQSAATDNGAGQTVPFYFKPTLGGSTSHRGFNDFRFRDDAVVYLNAEYRWEAFSGLDMALFSDWGTVAPNIGQLKLSRAQERLRHRIPVQHLQGGLVSRRHRLRRRRRRADFFKFSKAF